MRFLPILSNGTARVTVSLSALNDRNMVELPFLLDTGATRTSINKTFLIKRLGYTDDWLQKNRIEIPEDRWPIIANGEKLQVYGIPAMRLVIDGHEIFRRGRDEYFLTSDVAPKLSFLLGTDILSYFDIFFKYSESRVYYEFRPDRTVIQKKPGDPFAYKVE